MRQSKCLVFNSNTVDNFAAFFNCTPAGRASDSDGPDLKLCILVGWGRSFLAVAWPTGVQLVFFLLLQIFSDVVWRPVQLIISVSPQFLFIMVVYYVPDDFFN